jgi:thioredoxin
MVNVNGEIFESKKVILAMGISKVKELPGEGKLLGNGVSYCATCDGMLYRGKNALVWDQSKDAWEEANFLQSIGVNVTFISKKPKQENLSNDIKFIEGTITEIIGENTVEAVNTGNDLIKTDAVFMLRDAVAPAALIDGLELDGNFINTNKHMETNIPGLYAAGDITGKPLQLSKAIGEGLIAAQHAALQIDKKENLNGRNIKIINSTQEFDDMIKQNRYVLAEFWAEWCTPCRMVAPVIEKVAEQYSGKINVAKVDIDEQQELAIRYGIQTIPTIIFFKEGKFASKEIGVKPLASFARMIDSNIA